MTLTNRARRPTAARRRVPARQRVPARRRGTTTTRLLHRRRHCRIYRRHSQPPVARGSHARIEDGYTDTLSPPRSPFFATETRDVYHENRRRPVGRRTVQLGRRDHIQVSVRAPHGFCVVTIACAFVPSGLRRWRLIAATARPVGVVVISFKLSGIRRTAFMTDHITYPGLRSGLSKEQPPARLDVTSRVRVALLASP